MRRRGEEGVGEGKRGCLELDRLLPDPPLLLVTPEGVVEEDTAPLRDVDSLVRRLLAECGDLVLLQGALEELREGFDGLLEVAGKERDSQ